MRRTQTPNNPETGQSRGSASAPHMPRRGAPYANRVRRAHVALLGLLLLAVLLSAGILLVKFKLAEVRAYIERQIAERTGVDFEVKQVSIDGLRGLRFEELRASYQSPNGTAFRVELPSCRVEVDLIDLLYGTMTLDRIQTDGASLVVTLPKSATAPSMPSLPDKEESLPRTAFRLLGTNCRIAVHHVPGSPEAVVLEALDFDVARMPDSNEVAATVSAVFAGMPLHGNLRFHSLEDFDLRAACDGLTTAALAPYLPAAREFVPSGQVDVRLRVAGYPGHTIVVHAEAPFSGVTARNQPAFLLPVSGTLVALADFKTDSRQLTLNTAQISADQFAARVEGTVALGESPPSLALVLDVERLPLAQMVNSALPFQAIDAGTLEVNLEEPSSVRVAISGTTNVPVIRADAQLSGGTVAFQPIRANLPSASFTLGTAMVSWSTEGGLQGGTASITGGTIEHALAGVRAQNISGLIRVENGAVLLDPAHLEVTGNPFVGRARYEIEQRRGTVELQGAFANIENTPLGKGIKETELAGSANLRCTGTIAPDRFSFDFAVDATQTAIEHDWWFYKPAGVGATLQGFNLEMVPRKSIKITGGLALGTSTGNVTLEFAFRKGRWRLLDVRGKANSIDVVGLGQCIRVPYTIGGSTISDGFFEWHRVSDFEDCAVTRVGGRIAEASFQPRATGLVLTGKNAYVEATIDNTDSERRTGNLHIEADDGRLPPFGQDWILPLKDPMYEAKYPGKPRAWTFETKAKHLEILPWIGDDFTTNGAFDDAHTEFARFGATLGDGSIEGAYRHERAENAMRLNARWQDVPAEYLVEHLNYPKMLVGKSSGNVDYTIDRDDPATLRGTGRFEMRSGQFSADFLVSQFQEILQSDLASLPPSLKFSQLDFDLALDGDRVRTSNIELMAPGITITGAGQFVTKADMDYEINVSLSADVASRMTVFQDYFNVAGHRLSQNTIDLAFHITGPTFKPSSQVVGLPPVGVTVVSGAAELGSEAFQVLDTPRQILIDLFKIGGVIMGTGR